MAEKVDEMKKKIEKLLNLAHDKDDEEGKTALRLARELMLKTGIEESDLGGAEEEEVQRILLYASKRVPTYIFGAINVACSFLKVMPLRINGVGIYAYSFSKEELERTKEVFDTILSLADSNAKRVTDKERPLPEFSTKSRSSFRNSYRYGFIMGVQEFIEEQDESEEFQEYALMLTNKLERVEKALEDGLGVQRTSRRINYENGAYSSGFEKGKKTDVTRRTLDGS